MISAQGGEMDLTMYRSPNEQVGETGVKQEPKYGAFSTNDSGNPFSGDMTLAKDDERLRETNFDQNELMTTSDSMPVSPGYSSNEEGQIKWDGDRAEDKCLSTAGDFGKGVFASLLNCPFCGRGYKRLASLNEHIKYRHQKNDDNFVCNICHYTFAYKSQLERHSVTHAPGRDKVCSVCGKAFINLHRLKRHLLTHTTANRKFKCDECGKAFKYKHHLKEHERIHSGEKPYECPNPTCNKRFSHSGSFSSHISSKKCVGGMRSYGFMKPESPCFPVMLPNPVAEQKFDKEKTSHASVKSQINGGQSEGQREVYNGKKGRECIEHGSELHSDATAHDRTVCDMEKTELFNEGERRLFRTMEKDGSNSIQCVSEQMKNTRMEIHSYMNEESACKSAKDKLTKPDCNATVHGTSKSPTRTIGCSGQYDNAGDPLSCIYCRQSFPDAIFLSSHERFMCPKKNSTKSPVPSRRLTCPTKDANTAILTRSDTDQFCMDTKDNTKSIKSKFKQYGMSHLTNKLTSNPRYHVDLTHREPTPNRLAQRLKRYVADNNEFHLPRNKTEEPGKIIADKVKVDMLLSPTLKLESHGKSQSANENNSNSALEFSGTRMSSLEASMRLQSNREEMEAKNALLHHYFTLQGQAASDQSMLPQNQSRSTQSASSTPPFFNFGMNPLPGSSPNASEVTPSSALTTEWLEMLSKSRGFPMSPSFGQQTLPTPYQTLFQQHLYQLALASVAQNGKSQKTTHTRHSTGATEPKFKASGSSNCSDVQSEPLDLTAPKHRREMKAEPSSPSDTFNRDSCYPMWPPTPSQSPMYRPHANAVSDMQSITSKAMTPYHIQKLVQSSAFHPTFLAMLMGNLAAYDFSGSGAKSSDLSSPIFSRNSAPAFSPELVKAEFSRYSERLQTRPVVTDSYGSRTHNSFSEGDFGTRPFANMDDSFLPTMVPSGYNPGIFSRRGRPRKRPYDTDAHSRFQGPFTAMEALMHESSAKYRRSTFSQKPFPSASSVELSRLADRIKGRLPSNQMLYKCDICEKSFQKQSSLTRHKYEHTGKRPHHCNECPKSFKHKHHLIEHQRLHSGEKPYQCDKCGKRFSHSGSYSQHMNHRYAYCKPEDTMMQELRQQLKKSNGDGHVMANLSGSFSHTSPVKAPTETAMQIPQKTKPMTTESGRLSPAKHADQQQNHCLRKSDFDSTKITDRQSGEDGRNTPVSRSSTDAVTSSPAPRNEGSPTIKEEFHADRSDDELDFADKSIKSATCHSPSSCSSDSMSSGSPPTPTKFPPNSHSIALATSNELQLH